MANQAADLFIYLLFTSSSTAIEWITSGVYCLFPSRLSRPQCGGDRQMIDWRRVSVYFLYFFLSSLDSSKIYLFYLYLYKGEMMMVYPDGATALDVE